MTDTNMSISDLESFFWNLTIQMLGLDPNAPENQDRVRIDWQKNGAPAWRIDQDVCFLMVAYDDDAITRQTEVSYEAADDLNATRSQSYTRVLRVSFVCYGPNSFGDADTIRSSLFQPQFTELLQSNNLALILDVPSPMRAPELYNGQWWHRTSLYARFNELVIKTSSVPYLQSADVQVVKG